MNRQIMTMLVGTSVLLGACATKPSVTVQRTDPQAMVDLSGNWNDSDANQVAQTMMRDCLSRPWANKFTTAKGRPPVIRLYPIRNRSSEHINTQFYTKQVEQELLNSGMVQVVADRTEAGDVRSERQDQAENASDETAKQQQQETGSDFILNGWIVTQNDAVDGKEVRAYVTTMELINSESNVKVWMKVHPIKKVVTRAESEW